MKTDPMSLLTPKPTPELDRLATQITALGDTLRGLWRDVWQHHRERGDLLRAARKLTKKNQIDWDYWCKTVVKMTARHALNLMRISENWKRVSGWVADDPEITMVEVLRKFAPPKTSTTDTTKEAEPKTTAPPRAKVNATTSTRTADPVPGAILTILSALDAGEVTAATRTALLNLSSRILRVIGGQAVRAC